MNSKSRQPQWRLAILSCAALLSLTSAVRADVKLAGAFGSHMVLQRDRKVPIWGTATVGEKVQVRFAGQTVATQAAADGKWTVNLEPMPASAESRTLSVSATNTVELTDVLVGEVWLCSGQSNMELTPPKGLVNPAPEIAAATWPKIRFILLDKVVAERPLGDVKGNWTECSPKTMQSFSALAYFFGREIHQKLNVPIGLIGAYYGGSNGVSWTRREALLADPQLKAKVDQWDGKLKGGPKEDAGPAVALKPNTGNGANSRYRPSNFYNGMIASLIPFACRGVIWYQGEADTANAADAALYAKLLKTLIEDWRGQWGQGDFPFLYVQLTSAEPSYPEPTDSAWARTRESQEKVLAVKNTGMVVTLDIGEDGLVHARNKKDIGLRMAATALNRVYGMKDVRFEGPFLKSLEVKGGQAILRFNHDDGGLVCVNPAGLKGFAIAGEDKTFVWADAKIEVDRVIVSSPKVANPVAVRYAWADNPQTSLANGVGQPAAPFRTDDWPAVKISNPRSPGY